MRVYKSKFFLVLLLLQFFSCSSNQGVSYTTDKETWPKETAGFLGFRAESPLYKADGQFRKWVFAKINVPKDDILQLSAIIYVDIASVVERTIRLTEDLKTKDYLNVKDFPLATIVISKVQKIENNQYKAEAALTLKGQTELLETVFTLSQKKEVFHVKGELVLLRNNFKIGTDKLKSIKNEVIVYYDTDLK